MMGTLIKAIAGMFVGAVIHYALTTYGGTTVGTVVIKNTGYWGNVTYANLITIGITGVLAFVTRSRGTIGAIFTVSFAWAVFYTLIQAIQGLQTGWGTA